MNTIHIAILITSVSLFSIGKAQDSLNKTKFPDGSISFQWINKADTFLVVNYPNGKKESLCKLRGGQAQGSYSRWYPNGKLMWKKQMMKGQANGTAVFYDQQGNRVAELNYTQGKITDTVFIRKNYHVVLGKITFSSRVVGGAVREDGQANVSEHSGIFKHCAMYAVKTDLLKKPRFISNFKSDEFGDFFILVPEGKLGFYPKSTQIESLAPGNYEPPQHMWNSGHDSWTVKGKLEVKKGDKLMYLELHEASVGYAP